MDETNLLDHPSNLFLKGGKKWAKQQLKIKKKKAEGRALLSGNEAFARGAYDPNPDIEIGRGLT